MSKRGKKAEYVALDFETYYDGTYTLKKMSTTMYIRDPWFQALCLGYRDSTMNAAEYVRAEDIPKFLRSYDWEKTPALAHHAHFDGLILSHHYGVKPYYWYDTLSMARPLHGGAIRNDLDTLAKYYGGKGKRPTGLLKGVRLAHIPPEDLAELGEYCAQDVDELVRIFTAMLLEYPRPELDLIDLTVRMYTDPVLLVNDELAKEELENERTRRDEIIARVADYCFTSPDRVPKLLRSREVFASMLRAEGVIPPMKLSPTTHNLTYAFAKSDENFQQLADHPNDNVRLLFEAKTVLSSTIAETRPARLIAHGKPALPIYLKYGAAHTLRWGGGDKLNPQNFPRKSRLRNCIIAPPGHKLVIVDSAQIEARTVAWLAGQEDLLTVFRDGKDPYAEFASKAFNKPVAPKEPSEERFVGKTCILGLGYGMGAPKLHYTFKMGIAGPPLILPLDFCGQLVQTYRATYHKITQLWRNMEYFLAPVVERNIPASDYKNVLGFSYQKIHLPNGMALKYIDTDFLWDKMDEKPVMMTYNNGISLYGGKITENVVQALARIVVAEQIARVAKLYRTVLMVHDEGVFCVPEDKAEEVLTFAVQQFSIPPEWAPDLPVSAEGKISDYYQK
jgi:DNA polymerase